MGSYNNNQENFVTNKDFITVKNSAIVNPINYKPIDRVISIHPVSSTANIYENNNLEPKHTQSLFQHYSTLESNNLKSS